MQLPVIASCFRMNERLHGCTIDEQRVGNPFGFPIIAHVGRGDNPVSRGVTGCIIPCGNGRVESRVLMTVAQINSTHQQGNGSGDTHQECHLRLGSRCLMHIWRPKLQMLLRVRAVVTKLACCMRWMRVATHHMYLTMMRPVEVGKLIVRTLVVFSGLTEQSTHKMLVARVAHGEKD